MIVGVPRETAARERRVALTPDDVAELSRREVHVLVEQGAGWAADFTDAAYRDAGASIVPGPEQVFAADVIAWVKPPAYNLDSMPLRRGQSLMGFQDPIHRQARIAALDDRGVRSIAFERIPSGSGSAQLDPLSAMSRIAGDVAYRTGRALLPERVRQRRVRALIVGCGRAGLAAIAAAVAQGDLPPTAIGSRADQENTVLESGAGTFLLRPDPAAIAAYISDADPELIICAAGHRGNSAPLLIDQVALDALTAGAVVVDLTAKAGGNCIATEANTTVRLDRNVQVLHRSNFPAERPHTASRAYGAATAAAILGLTAHSG